MLPAASIRAVMIYPRLGLSPHEELIMNAEQPTCATAGISGKRWIPLRVDLDKPTWQNARRNEIQENELALSKSNQHDPKKAVDSHRFSAAEDLTRIAHLSKIKTGTDISGLYLHLVFSSICKFINPTSCLFKHFSNVSWAYITTTELHIDYMLPSFSCSAGMHFSTHRALLVMQAP